MILVLSEFLYFRHILPLQTIQYSTMMLPPMSRLRSASAHVHTAGNNAAGPAVADFLQFYSSIVNSVSHDHTGVPDTAS